MTTFLFLFRRFIQVKQKSFDASIKSLAEESIEKINVSSPKETKQNIFFFIRIFLSKKKNVEKIFSFQLNEIDEKQFSRSLKFAADKKSTNRRKKKHHFKEKICKILTKFHNFTRKNSFNSNLNDK